MNGVTAPVIGFTVTIRELLFCPPPWVDWLESVANSLPPERPLTNPMSIAGPAGWNPPPLGVGLPKGPRISVPLRLNTRMSGVKGLVELKVPPTAGPPAHCIGYPPSRARIPEQILESSASHQGTRFRSESSSPSGIPTP